VVLLDLATSAAARGDSQADLLFERATTAHEQTFGTQHPNTGRALYLAAARSLHSSRRPSASSQVARATEILSEALGEEHPWTLEARGLTARTSAV
jgi:hypothetical protein